MARTYQGTRLFEGMTVEENILVGFHRYFEASLFGLIFRSSAARAEEAVALERARCLLKYVGLAGLDKTFPSQLPYGHQRRLEIARAIATRPRVLLLDEPTAGMNPGEKQEIAKLISQLNRDGITILLVDHDMRLVSGLCPRLVALNYGEKIAEGPPGEVCRNPLVVESYLGTSS
jgi:ABC-type branched-subunit amino acid transport system ATPase component